MSAQHTPGPWTYNGATDIHAGEASGFTICEIYPNDSMTVMGKANANLIAAAPDLLEALEQISRVADAIPVIPYKTAETLVKTLALAAIAKAKGETK